MCGMANFHQNLSKIVGTSQHTTPLIYSEQNTLVVVARERHVEIYSIIHEGVERRMGRGGKPMALRVLRVPEWNTLAVG